MKSGKRNITYDTRGYKIELCPNPIVAQRAPTATDRAEVGQAWIDQPNDDVYVLTRIVANSATWINTGGGSGVFNSLSVTTSATIGTTLSVGTDLTVSGLGLGVVQSDATGLFTSSAGTNGQILCGSTGLAPAWTSITSATLVITPGAGTLNIEESGGTANSFVTDVAGPIAPLAGVTTITGNGANITTDGSVANTIGFDLANSITLVGAVTAGVDLNMTSGDCTIIGTTNAPQTIYLHENAGAAATIDIHADQSSSVASIYVHSDIGGLDFRSGLGTADAINITATDAASGIDIDCGTSGLICDTTGAISLDSAAASNFTVTGAFDLSHISTLGSVILNGGEAVADAVQLTASDAAGGITCATGTGGFTLTSTNGTVAITSGTAAINVGVDTVQHDITIGNVTGSTGLYLNSGTNGINLASTGTGDIVINSDDTLLLDSDGVLELNSSAGIISIGNDNDDFGINVGSAGNRPIVIGATGGTSSLTLNSGSGNTDIDSGGTVNINSTAGILSLGNNADNFDVNISTGGVRVTTIGNIGGASQVVLNSGTAGVQINTTGAGDFVVTSGDAIELDAVGVAEINSSGAAIGIGSDNDDFAVNIATAGNRAVTIGAVGGTTDISLDAAAGIDINDSGGIVTMTPATDTQAAAAVTIDANVGVGTFTGLVTAAAASQVLTVTNSVCTATSAILCTLANKGANDAQCCITRVIPAAGSFTVTYQNLGAAALNGDLILTFWIIA